MTKWYDRIGNTIEMRVGNQWIKGTIINGCRTHDGLINMKAEDDKTYWCGVAGEYIHFRKCEDSLGDLMNNADHIRSMTDEQLAEAIDNSNYCLVPSEFVDTEFCDATSDCKSCILNWLKQPYKSV